MKNYIKMIKRVALVGLYSMASFASASASLIITDTFENRTVGSGLNQSATSGPNQPAQWYWQGANNDPVISEIGGNKFADFSGMGFLTLSFSSTQFSPGRIALSSSQAYQLNYDLIWLQSFGGPAANPAAAGFSVFLNTDNTFANFATAGTPGYLFRAAPSGINEVSWQILQNRDQTVASGSLNVSGAINLTNGQPGTPIPIQIDWMGNDMTYTIDGNIVWSSQSDPSFTPAAQNVTLPDTTHLMFQLAQSRNQGIDNITLVPEPATYAGILGLLALSLVFLRRRRS